MTLERLFRHGLPLLALTAVAACSSNHDDDFPAMPRSTITGVAAVGLPISGGAVAATCNAYTDNTTTAANGSWTLTLPTSALPCVARVNGGTLGAGGPANLLTLYSMSGVTGATTTANITPLTDFALARAVFLSTGADMATWFGNGTTTLPRLSDVATGLPAGRDLLKTVLDNAGYAYPQGGFDPFFSSIAPGVAGDIYDQFLETFAQGIAAATGEGLTAPQAYQAALDGFSRASQPTVPRAPGAGPGPGPDPGPGPGPGPGPDPDPVGETPDTALGANETGVRFETSGTVQGAAQSHALRFFPGPGTISAGTLAGFLDEVTANGPTPNSYVNFRNLPDAPGTYDCGDALGVTRPRNIEIGFAAGHGYNTAGTLGATGFHCTLVVTKAGLRTPGGTYEGAVEGSFDARLYKTGQAVNLPDSIAVTGHFRIGEVSTTVPPVSGTTLASLIGAGYQGTYVVGCGDRGQQTIVVNADGTSSVNGVAVVDGTHPGIVGTRGNVVSFERRADDLGSALPPSYSLIFNNGSVSSASILFTAGAAPVTCSTAVSGSTTTTKDFVDDAMALFARSETLNCPGTASLPAGPTLFTIASDGGLTLGSLSITPAQYLASQNFTFTDAHTFLLHDSAPFFYSKSALRVSANGYTYVVALDPVTQATVSLDYVIGLERGTCAP
ncbi:hypothetical protein DFR24_4272 [Panacagrimonas perspica]|uniref:Uncharacterized protein n=1 Tax=Panacagrimonas perspica TaxID=381431 RepID=A0A4S3K410_9GAMM|nr:hypothetical protein [Panacagrimonas perspica]TDU25827.1 hypothetical protein DFR24_4272 [Panacagrimonas perspica]THD02805.1 hypothetical protein B1810_12860 [Panacagrimonas perspica]